MRRIELSDGDHGRIMGVMDVVRQLAIRETREAAERGNAEGERLAKLRAHNVAELQRLFQTAETF